VHSKHADGLPTTDLTLLRCHKKPKITNLNYTKLQGSTPTGWQHICDSMTGQANLPAHHLWQQHRVQVLASGRGSLSAAQTSTRQQQRKHQHGNSSSSSSKSERFPLGAQHAWGKWQACRAELFRWLGNERTEFDA
jgi:hypothetical protein